MNDDDIRRPRRTQEFLPQDAAAAESDACDAVCARLIEGAGAPLSADVAAHVGSCLRCFRVSAEMRDVPRIAAALCRGARDEDPGDAFWQSFPPRVGEAFELARARALATPAAPVVKRRRLSRFVQQPVAAAVLGAAAALVLIASTGRLSLHRAADPTDGGRRPAPAPLVIEKPVQPLAAGSGLAAFSGTFGAGEATGEALQDLEVPALQELVDEMRAETASVTAPDEAPAWKLNPAGEIELMDEDALEQLLGGLPQTI